MSDQPKNNDKQPNSPKKESTSGSGKFNHYWIYGIILLGLMVLMFNPLKPTYKQISEQHFFSEILPTHNIDKLIMINKKRVEIFIQKDSLEKYKETKYKDVPPPSFGDVNIGPHYYFTIASVDVFAEHLDKAQNNFGGKRVEMYSEDRTDWDGVLITWILPIAILIILWIIIMRRVSGVGGGPGTQIFNIGKSRATLFDKDTQVNVTFDDVAGLDEAKEEVLEVVDFLKNPQKYTSLGGKIPKGVLLIGSPGTGKTLLAKAVAGEAQVPFFSISGSDFVELFVGVGASRVRDLFKQAREKAPCIIFIDEIDAIGRARGRNMIQGGNDERENTLNALLVEMDGFSSDKGVIIMAATNRPDVLDSALLRPGRFDRQIGIDKPDIKGRSQIFKVHLGSIKTSPDIDIEKLAAQTPGFAGADIANVCNEAALIAARRNKIHVEMQDFQDAVDRVIGGLEKKNKIIAPHEKEIIAYHEAGHAISGWFLEHAHPLLKVTIVPRGMAALGYAQYLPKEQYLYTTEQLLDDMCMTLGGRAAEDITFGRISTGAQNDLERITRMAYAMVSIYGMNDKVGNVSFKSSEGDYNFQKPYSDETAQMIDEEVRKMIARAYQRTKQLLLDKQRELEIVAQALLEKEILFKSDLDELIGARPFEDQTRIQVTDNNNGTEKSNVEETEQPNENGTEKSNVEETITE